MRWLKLNVYLWGSLLWINPVPAQIPIPQLIWSQSFGGFSSDDCYSVKPTPDQGFILGGYTYSTGAAGNGDFCLVKINSQGQLQWYQIYGGSAPDQGYSVITTQDGGYALAGFTMSYGAGLSDMYLVKTDASGNLQWQRTYGTTGYDWAYSLQQTADGGFILGGDTGTSYDDMYLVKTDSLGNMQWQQTYGGAYVDFCYSVVPTTDGGYALGGKHSIVTGNSQMWLVKTNSTGELQWSRDFGGALLDNCNSLCQTYDGGYILGGSSTSFGSGDTDFYLVKTDSLGNHQWEHVYGGEFGDICHEVLLTPDQGYLLSGTAGGNYWVVKTDSSGNALWDQSFSYGSGDICFSMCQAADGIFLLGGTGYFNSDNMFVVHMSGLQQAWVSLTPQSPSITIPASGGSFQYTISVQNYGTIHCRPEVWLMVQLPNNAWYGPILGPISFNLDISATLSRLRTQYVPANAPSGSYTYWAYVGAYPDSVWDEDSFPFTKLGSDPAYRGAVDWTNTGEDFVGGTPAVASLSGSGTTPTTVISPNPFNPSTAISYQLSANSFVSLRVYDTAGRLVANLVDGWQTAGRHLVYLDGAAFATGIYYCRLSVAGNLTVQKIVFLK